MVIELKSENADLLAIYMQNCLCIHEGSVVPIGLNVSKCIELIQPYRAVLDLARNHSIPVIFSPYVIKQDYSDGDILIKHLRPALAGKGTLKEGRHNIEIIPEMNVGDDEILFNKNRPDSFRGINLDELLERLGELPLIVCGITTNCSVETTVLGASQKGYEVFAVDEACGKLDDERHRVALKTMNMLFLGVASVDSLRSIHCGRFCPRPDKRVKFFANSSIDEAQGRWTWLIPVLKWMGAKADRFQWGMFVLSRSAFVSSNMILEASHSRIDGTLV